MTPPCHSFPASQLPLKIQVDVHGRRRKHDASSSPTHKIDLSACELFRTVQYKCHVQDPSSPDDKANVHNEATNQTSRCKDKKETFMVETTAWEGTEAAIMSKKDGDARARPFQWSTSWVDGDAAK
ncbi:hypothetical protein E4U21_005755 [Claviceps maximensis]|nr:hypothetical protein E4U21_005755 [Claviceps maximensis]